VTYIVTEDYLVLLFGIFYNYCSFFFSIKLIRCTVDHRININLFIMFISNFKAKGQKHYTAK